MVHQGGRSAIDTHPPVTVNVLEYYSPQVSDRIGIEQRCLAAVESLPYCFIGDGTRHQAHCTLTAVHAVRVRSGGLR